MIRERKEELTSTIAFSANAEATYLNGVPRDLPLTRMLIVVEGRFNVASQTAAGTILPEAPVSLVANLQVKGTKVTGGGSVTLVNASGEELYELTHLYEQYDAVGIRRRATDVPGTVFPAAGAATAVGSFDFRFALIVPIAPRFATQEDEIEGILDPSIFSQLDLVIKWRDTPAIFTGGTAVVSSLTAYGSAAGVPTARITRFSPLAAGLPINKYHYTLTSRQINMGALPAAGSDTKIQDIQSGNKIRTMLLRQYTEVAGIPKLMAAARVGDNSAAGIFRWRVKLNGAEKVRVNNKDLQEMNAQQANMRSTSPDPGYSMIDWADRGFLEDIFDTRGFGASATRFELVGDWTGLGATDRLDILQIEQIPVEV